MALGLVAIALRPGQLVEEASPGRVDRALLVAPVELLRAAEPPTKLALHALGEGLDDTEAERVIADADGRPVLTLDAIRVARHRALGEVPSLLADARALVAALPRIVREPKREPRRAPEHAVVLGRARERVLHERLLLGPRFSVVATLVQLVDPLQHPGDGRRPRGRGHRRDWRLHVRPRADGEQGQDDRRRDA